MLIGEFVLFFFNDTATTEIYTLSLHDALPISHVGVRSAEKAIAIANALTGYIPHFLALSASSPWWKGRDTGLASCRTKVFEGLPTAGLPQLLGGWDQFQELMTTLISAKAISSIRAI